MFVFGSLGVSKGKAAVTGGAANLILRSREGRLSRGLSMALWLSLFSLALTPKSRRLEEGGGSRILEFPEAVGLGDD